MRVWFAVVLAIVAAGAGCAASSAAARFEDAHRQRVAALNERFDAQRRALETEQPAPADPFSPAASPTGVHLARALAGRIVIAPSGPVARAIADLERAREAAIADSARARDQAITADLAAHRARVQSYAQRTGRTDSW